jgi:hypothetical protein
MATDEAPWWPGGKVYGRHLTAVLAQEVAA